MPKRLMILLLLLITLNIFSQHIVNGKVVDTNNFPLEFANVILYNTKNKKIITGKITNKDGNFELSLERNVKFKITISYIGFESWEKEISLNRDINLGKISLKETNNLDEVTIRARKKIITNQGDKTVFNVKNSPLKKGYETMELLKVTPYVWVDMNNKISINGENATILVNGRKLNLSASDIKNYLSNFSSENISKIEVKTNQSASQDASTTGGIINIILAKKEKGFRSKLNTSYTFKNKGYNTYSNISFNYGTDKWNVYGSYGLGLYNFFSETINTVRFLEQNRKINTITKKNNLSKKHNYTIGFVNKMNNHHQIGFELYGIQRKKDYSRLGKATYFTNGNLTDNATIDVYGNGDGTSFNSVLNYKWKMSDSNNIKAYLDYSYNKSNDFNLSETNYINESYNNNENKYNSNSKTKVVDFQLDYGKVFKNKINLNFGVKYTNTNRFSDLFSGIRVNDDFFESTNQTTNSKYKEQISAIYISSNKKIKDNRYLKLGLRIERTAINNINLKNNNYFNKKYTNFFPSFYYSRTITNNKSTSFSYSRSLRRPRFELLNEDIEKVNDFQYYIGNPDLNPEFTDKFEIKYSYKKHYFSVYYNNTKDKITAIYYIENNIAYYKTINLGFQRRLGIGYRFTKKMNKWWFVNMSSYIYNGRFIDKNDNASFIKTTYGFRLYNNIKINKTTKIDLSGYYRSPSASAYYHGFEVYSVNLGLKKTLLENKLNLSIYFNDIFNSFSFKTSREFEKFKAYYEEKPNRRSLRIKLIYNISNNKKVIKDKNKSKNKVKRRI